MFVWNLFSHLLWVFACFRLWVIYKVNYCLPVRVGGRIFPPCWRGWIQFGAKLRIGLDLRIFSGFRDTFQNENVVHLLSIKNCHLVIQARACSIFIKLEGVLKIHLSEAIPIHLEQSFLHRWMVKMIYKWNYEIRLRVNRVNKI